MDKKQSSNHQYNAHLPNDHGQHTPRRRTYHWSGCSTATLNGIPIALQGDKCICAAGGQDVILQGCPTATINGVPIALQGSPTAHGGTIPVRRTRSSDYYQKTLQFRIRS